MEDEVQWDLSTIPLYARHLDNGTIDVTPIGEYIALTNKNATDSPLLRLPAELRSVPWKYALDGHTIRPCFKSRNLRVSRQIYTDAAILPYTLSTFTFFNFGSFNTWIKDMLPWQYKAVQHVQDTRLFGSEGGCAYFRLLRSLKSVRLHFCPDNPIFKDLTRAFAEEMTRIWCGSYTVTHSIGEAQLDGGLISEWMKWAEE